MMCSFWNKYEFLSQLAAKWKAYHISGEYDWHVLVHRYSKLEERQNLFGKDCLKRAIEKQIFHKFSPQYQKLSHEAEEIFKDHDDPEVSDLFKKIYIRLKNKSWFSTFLNFRPL